MITQKDIVAAFRSYSKEKIKTIKPFTSGHINKLYEIQTSTDTYIFRLFNEPWKAKKEQFVYDTIKNNSDIPIPNILYLDDSLETLPQAFSIMTKLPGEHLDVAFSHSQNKKLFLEAGELLAHLHNITFSSFGWIVGHAINPSFSSWEKFVEHDVTQKLENISSLSEVRPLVNTIQNFFSDHKELLSIKQKPCLLHKDYHPPHILATKEKITGIIDVEWAMSGHNESDFTKMELWTFNKLPKMRETFFEGYTKHNSISKDYEQRKKIYELWHRISMVNISLELNDNTWLTKNSNSLKNFF